MTKSINIFFALLRSGMYGTPIPDAELPEAIDWPTVAAFAQKQAVYGIIAESVQYLPDRLRPQGKIAARMSKFALGLIQANMVFDKTAARLAGFLQQHGVNGVLLKGQGVARYFRQPQMRQSGDIDFYVGKRAYKQAVALCKEHLSEHNDEMHTTEQHFSFVMNGVPIELHRLASKVYTPIRSGRFQRWVEDELEGSGQRRTLTIDGTPIALPSYDFDAIYIFYHAWRHFITGGIGIRQISDWAMIFHSHSADIDRDKLINNIRRFGLTHGWKLFACIAVKYLGVSADKIPLYDPSYQQRADKILAEIVEGGNFGFYSESHSRLPNEVTGLRYGLAKLRLIHEYWFALFPLIPVEATFLYFNRLIFGTVDCTKRTINKK